MNLPPDFEVCPSILELESNVGVPENFFRALSQTDDWSFVIKLHALFEAACTHLLLHHFKEPELTDVFSRLELSNKVTGKIAFLKKSGLLNKESRQFISALSELRNSLVHDVRNAEFSLPTMVATLNAAEIKNMAVSFSPFESHIRRFSYDTKMKLGYEGDLAAQAELPRVIKRFTTDAKKHIWIGAHHVLGSIVEMYSYSDYKQWVKAKQHFADEDEP
jgi:hypothetical protein